jgi:hypothetical protein
VLLDAAGARFEASGVTGVYLEFYGMLTAGRGSAQNGLESAVASDILLAESKTRRPAFFPV